MEHFKHRYETNCQHYRAVTRRFRISWASFYALLILILWQILQRLPPPGIALDAQLSQQLPLWSLCILLLLGISLIQSRLRALAASRLLSAQHAYKKILKELRTIARENGDTRGQTEAETELQRLQAFAITSGLYHCYQKYPPSQR